MPRTGVPSLSPAQRRRQWQGIMSALSSANEKLRRAATTASRKINPKNVRIRTISALESDMFATRSPLVPNMIIDAIKNTRFFDRDIIKTPKIKTFFSISYVSRSSKKKCPPDGKAFLHIFTERIFCCIPRNTHQSSASGLR